MIRKYFLLFTIRYCHRSCFPFHPVSFRLLHMFRFTNEYTTKKKYAEKCESKCRNSNTKKKTPTQRINIIFPEGWRENHCGKQTKQKPQSIECPLLFDLCVEKKEHGFCSCGLVHKSKFVHFHQNICYLWTDNHFIFVMRT